MSHWEPLVDLTWNDTEHDPWETFYNSRKLFEEASNQWRNLVAADESVYGSSMLKQTAIRQERSAMIVRCRAWADQALAIYEDLHVSPVNVAGDGKCGASSLHIAITGQQEEVSEGNKNGVRRTVHAKPVELCAPESAALKVYSAVYSILEDNESRLRNTVGCDAALKSVASDQNEGLPSPAVVDLTHPITIAQRSEADEIAEIIADPPGDESRNQRESVAAEQHFDSASPAGMDVAHAFDRDEHSDVHKGGGMGADTPGGVGLAAVVQQEATHINSQLAATTPTAVPSDQRVFSPTALAESVMAAAQAVAEHPSVTVSQASQTQPCRTQDNARLIPDAKLSDMHSLMLRQRKKHLCQIQ